MQKAVFKKNAFIFEENSEGSDIFVSAKGSFDIIQNGEVVESFGPGLVFGELAILHISRQDSIQAKTKAHVWKIDRRTFHKIMIICNTRQRQENLIFLKSSRFLSDLPDEVLYKVADLLQLEFYETGACIVREDEMGNDLYIIRGGTVTVKKKSKSGEEYVVDHKKCGDFFGVQALLFEDRRLVSVYADAPGTKVLKLNREDFNNYLGTIQNLHARPRRRRRIHSPNKFNQAEIEGDYSDIKPMDLPKIATLGTGTFGKVYLVLHGNKIFALKIIKKNELVQKGKIENVYWEKYVMQKCRGSPFFVQLYKTYRNKKIIYFLMEACMGGSVATQLEQHSYFDEKTAKFIAACVVEALDYMHSKNIFYRSLKPQNLMLDTEGYCKLIDFGMAKQKFASHKSNTFIGTHEYVAPEIILFRGHDRAVDYWALGIIIFEMLAGQTPFTGPNQFELYQQILRGIESIQMPSKISKPAQDLIRSLCKQKPTERLGNLHSGITGIKTHSWFKSIDWEKLKAQKVVSPLKRSIKSSTDLSNYVAVDEKIENDKYTRFK